MYHLGKLSGVCVVLCCVSVCGIYCSSSGSIKKKLSLHPVYKFAAGAIAGSVATLLTYPLDVLRVRLALTPGATWQSTIKQGGLMRGLVPTVVGIIPYSGTAWTVKQSLHEGYEEWAGKQASLQIAVILNGLAGLAGQFVTYPLDILRRRMQMSTSDVGAREVLIGLYKNEGINGLWKGFSMNIFKGPITISVSMTTYDMLMRWLKEKDIN